MSKPPVVNPETTGPAGGFAFGAKRVISGGWVNLFAWFTAFSTLCLIGVGGVVTSKGAGMAVPDWPTSYGYNMFALPFSYWVGGIFWEHSHRLWASVVGMLVVIQMIALYRLESRSWVRKLGGIAFVLVVFQGLLGGMRVTLFKDELGIFHATLAQIFFCLVCWIAVVTSSFWGRLQNRFYSGKDPHLHRFFLVASACMLVQLVLGATMRHEHAGLAIPDFPLAYGKVWPPTDPEFLLSLNQSRSSAVVLEDITATHILVHMSHRLWALVVLTAVGISLFRLKRSPLLHVPSVSRLAFLWGFLILAQGLLGAWTVWSNKAADVATLHVVTGAMCLALAISLTLLIRVLGGVRRSAHQVGKESSKTQALQQMEPQSA